MKVLSQLIKAFAARLSSAIASPNTVIIAVITEEGIVVVAPPKLASKLGEFIEDEINSIDRDNKHLLN